MDLHYFQSCPMLTQCSECQQIIEIATLSEHLLTECEQRSKYEPCPNNCGEALKTAELDSHLAARSCRPLPDPTASNRCPLCRADISPDKEGWVHHLVDEGCPKNPRKRA